MWFQFYDMHSGGGQKTDFEKIYIKASNEGEAYQIFEDKFGFSADNVTCECCGHDFWVSEYETLEDATECDRLYYRNLLMKEPETPLSKYIQDKGNSILIIDEVVQV